MFNYRGGNGMREVFFVAHLSGGTPASVKNGKYTIYTSLFQKQTFLSRARKERERERERRRAMSSTTRARERRAGERNVWDVIVNNDDICFKHILPRLNQTDIKFVYDVNSETRALIKRSSRKGELKKKTLKIEEGKKWMLEFAWENRSLWPSWWSERDFCWRVALTNKLELLKWIREEKKCEWDEETISIAARRGNLEMVKYCVANQCPVSEEVCTDAASNGRLKVLKYLHEEAKAPWDSEAIAEAYFNCKHDCLQYLLDNDCPLLDGWWYDGVHLHTF